MCIRDSPDTGNADTGNADTGNADTGAPICSSTSSAIEACRVRFDGSIADGSSRVLFYERGDVTVRWVLS